MKLYLYLTLSACATLRRISSHLNNCKRMLSVNSPKLIKMKVDFLDLSKTSEVVRSVPVQKIKSVFAEDKYDVCLESSQLEWSDNTRLINKKISSGLFKYYLTDTLSPVMNIIWACPALTTFPVSEELCKELIDKGLMKPFCNNIRFLEIALRNIQEMLRDDKSDLKCSLSKLESNFTYFRGVSDIEIFIGKLLSEVKLIKRDGKSYTNLCKIILDNTSNFEFDNIIPNNISNIKLDNIIPDNTSNIIPDNTSNIIPNNIIDSIGIKSLNDNFKLEMVNDLFNVVKIYREIIYNKKCTDHKLNIFSIFNCDSSKLILGGKKYEVKIQVLESDHIKEGDVNYDILGTDEDFRFVFDHHQLKNLRADKIKITLCNDEEILSEVVEVPSCIKDDDECLDTYMIESPY